MIDKVIKSMVRIDGDTAKLKYDFLVKHQDASEIIIHERSGLPVKAIYNSVFNSGKFRKLLDELDAVNPEAERVE